MKFSNCNVEAHCENGTIKLKKISEDKLLAETRCKCGAPITSVNFNSGVETYILEQLASARAKAEELGRTTYHSPINEPKTLRGECLKCGRFVVGHVNFKLDRKVFRRFDKAHTKGEGEGVYGGLLKIVAKVRKGYFEEFRRTDDPRDLLRPRCSCGNRLVSVEARESFEKIVKQITDFFEVEEAEEPKEIQIKEKLNCPHCLSTVKLEMKLIPNLPENDGVPVYINAYRQWCERTLGWQFK
jgi:hypothetical protein